MVLVVGDDLQRHGSCPLQLLKDMGEPGGQRIGVHGNGHRNRCLRVRRRIEFAQGAALKQAQRLDMTQQHFAGRRRDHRFLAHQQYRGERLLETTDALRYRAARDAQLRCGAFEALRFGNGREGFQLIAVQHLTPPEEGGSGSISNG